MKKNYRFLFYILSFAIIVCCNSIAYVKADEDGYVCKKGYHDFGDKYLRVNNKKKGSKSCYIDTSLSKKKKNVEGAINAWNNRIKQYGTKSKVNLSNISDKATAKIIIKDAYLGKNVGGLTHFFPNEKELSLNKKGELPGNYDKVIVQVNSSILNNSEFLRVTTHEIGHALGLSHQINNKKCIMYNYYTRVQVGVPSKKDVDTAMHIYN